MIRFDINQSIELFNEKNMLKYLMLKIGANKFSFDKRLYYSKNSAIKFHLILFQLTLSYI